MAEDSTKIVKTDILKVEIFDMPVIDLSRRFCYRFVEPIPMIWQTDGRVAIRMLESIGLTQQDVIAQFVLMKYKEVIENSKNQGNWLPELEWLEQVHSVEVVECDLVAKNTFNFTQKSIDEEIKQKVEGR